MSQQLRLSLNELSALLKSVFQACFGHSQDWAAMAETVLWLETRGLNGLTHLMDAFEADLTLPAFSAGLQKTATGYRIDCNGSSLLLGMHMITDVARDYARREGECTIIIENVRHTVAVLAAAIRCMESKDNVKFVSDLDMSLHDPQSLAQAYVQSLYHGIAVPSGAYRILTKIADRILVEATEVSRKGAGE